MRSVRLVPCFVVAALSSGACTPPPPGVVSATGYDSNDYEFRVASSAAYKDILPAEWKLDNYYYKDDPVGDPVLTPKDGDQYLTEYEFDVDGDGEADSTQDEFTYELRYTHEAHDGVIFLRLIPVSQDQGKKRLKVLLSRYVEAIAGAGYELVRLDDETSLMVKKQYAAAVVAEGEAKIAGRPAYAARLEVANLDQIKIDPDARKEQVELIMTHTPFKYVPSADSTYSQPEFPVVLLAGYANQPEEFEEGLPDFRALLNRVFVNGSHGFQLPAATKTALSTAGQVEQTPRPAEGVSSDAESEVSAGQATSSKLDEKPDQESAGTRDDSKESSGSQKLNGK